METVFLIARILFFILFTLSAVGHLTQSKAMAGYAQSKGIPSPQLAVQGSGVLLLLGALSVLLGIWGDLGALVLAVLMVVFAVTMHAFWKEGDAQAKMSEQTQFNKDIALAGGALAFYLVYYSHLGDSLWTITGPLFN